MDRTKEENLMVVAAVEGYSFKYEMETKEAFDLLRQHNVFGLIRSQYDTLHTQGLYEGVSFAEDILSRGNE